MPFFIINRHRQNDNHGYLTASSKNVFEGFQTLLLRIDFFLCSRYR